MWILLLYFGLSYLFLRAILKDLISVCEAIMFLISRINKVRRNMKFFQSFFQKTRHSSQFLKEYLLWKFWNIPREINTVGLIFHKVTGATLLFPKHLLRFETKKWLLWKIRGNGKNFFNITKNSKMNKQEET